MRSARSWVFAGTAALAAAGLAAPVHAARALAAPMAAARPPAAGRVALPGTAVPASERARPAGPVAPGSTVRFSLLLALRDAAGARAFARAVSSPGSRLFRRYLTTAGWVSRYGPARSEVSRARSWLRRAGFTAGPATPDRLLVAAEGPARLVQRAFGVRLGYYLVNGHRVRLASGTMTIPAGLAGVISGVVGVNQFVAAPGLARGGTTARGEPLAAQTGQEPPPPAGFRNPQPCSAYWGQKLDSRDSPGLYAPYSPPLPYAICGYRPFQLRGAYGLAGQVAAGVDGRGVRIAIVDAYDSPTLLSDAQRYFRINDPAHPLRSSQFTDLPPASVDDVSLCDGSGWLTEQALDVEASHAMAPGASITYVGARDCLDASLLTALQAAVTSGASVVSDSWGDTLGDIFTDAATKAAYDDTFLLAASTGVSVLFASGDLGDNFGASGIAAPDYPASSPLVTAVGGTTLEVNRRNARQAEYGWSTARQVLCAPRLPFCRRRTPAGSLGWQAGGGGGTSYTYAQPSYQAKVVPQALALRNEPLLGPVPMRVIPDISMDADAQSGMLIGLTQAFPNGVYYDQFKVGGTSLATPLLAGVVADASQAAGASLGFLNPVLYQAYTRRPGAFRDILPSRRPLAAAVIRVDYANSVSAAGGYVISLRVITYEGPETYCDGTGNCATRAVTLTTAPGFDSMTGLGTVGPAFIAALARP